MKALVVLVVMASTAHADTAEQLTEHARELAREGRCDELPAIGRRVDAQDDDYYTRVYSLDPVIAGCKQIDARFPQLLRDPTTPPKDPAVALGLSLGITAAGVGLVLAGYASDSRQLAVGGGMMAFVGPEAGHFYAHHVSGGIAFEGLGVVVAVLGRLSCIDECRGDAADHTTTYVAGGIFYAAGAIYSIATAPGAADDYNRDPGVRAKIVPTGNGLALVGTF